MKKRDYKIFAALITAMLLCLVVFYFASYRDAAAVGLPEAFLKRTPAAENNINPPQPAEEEFPILYPPISNAIDRVAKKPFGKKVSPGNSPVDPERFAGYHTGIDFEIFPGEEDADLPVYAACSGELIKKEQARGYGGMIVQRCLLDNEDITVVYGHVS